MRTLTIWLMLAGIALYIAYDIVAVSFGGGSATISEITLGYLTPHPAFAVLLGGLFGHLTWPLANNRPNWLKLLLACSVGGTLLALNFFAPLPAIMPLIPFAAGVVLGHFVAPQQPV